MIKASELQMSQFSTITKLNNLVNYLFNILCMEYDFEIMLIT